MDRRVTALVLVALGLLATAALLFLVLVQVFVATSPLTYLLYGLLLLVLIWWDIRFHVRVIRSRAPSDPDRAPRERRERAAKTRGVDALILGGVALVVGVVLHNTCTTGITGGAVSACFEYGYRDIAFLAMVVGGILAVVGIVLLTVPEQPRRAQ